MIRRGRERSNWTIRRGRGELRWVSPRRRRGAGESHQGSARYLNRRRNQRRREYERRVALPRHRGAVRTRDFWHWINVYLAATLFKFSISTQIPTSHIPTHYLTIHDGWQLQRHSTRIYQR